jgi:hypothetical protein
MSPVAAALMRPTGAAATAASVQASPQAAVPPDQAALALREAVLVASAAVTVAAASAEAGDTDGWSQRGAGLFRRWALSPR